MQRPLFAAALLAVASEAHACGAPRPDPAIPLPPRVESFIEKECRQSHGLKEQDACREGERAGYRATVTMLTDEATAEAATDRYRTCRTAPAPHGGRFHREKAACIADAVGVAWHLGGPQCEGAAEET